MAYGMNIYVDGYPPINFENWSPYATLGTYGFSYAHSSTSRISRNFNWTYPTPTPSGTNVRVGGDVYFFDRTGSERAGVVMGNINSGTTSCNGNWYPLVSTGTTWSGGFLTAVGDFTNVRNAGNYGLFVNNNGVASILNNQVPPLHVIARYEININSGARDASYDLAELAGNFNGSNTRTVFFGSRNNDVAVTVSAQSRNLRDYSGGIRLYCKYGRTGLAHGGRYRGYDQTSDRSSKLYIIIADRVSTTPTGYGINVYNNSGNITFSESHIPLLPRGVLRSKGWTSGYSSPNPSMLGTADTVPSPFVSSDTVMMPLGCGTKGQLGYHDYESEFGSTQWFGYGYSFISGNQFRTCQFYDTATPNLGGGPLSDGFFGGNYNYYESEMGNREYIPIVRGEDYYLSLYANDQLGANSSDNEVYNSGVKTESDAQWYEENF